jgi:hypothetical protein
MQSLPTLYMALLEWDDFSSETIEAVKEHWFERWQSFLEHHGIGHWKNMDIMRTNKGVDSSRPGTAFIEFEILNSLCGYSTGMWARVNSDNVVYSYQCSTGESWDKCNHKASDFDFENVDTETHKTTQDATQMKL